MSYRALVALTHVASQLVYRWLPPPLQTAEGGLEVRSSDEAVLPAPKAFWLSLIGDERTRSRLPWLADYLKRFDPGGERLASAIAEHLGALTAGRGAYLLWGDPLYPKSLSHLSDPPLGLAVLGDLTLLTTPMISVVGSRKASVFAMRESWALGQALAQAGQTVVSGGAFGCDIAAHQGVLAGGRRPAPAACVFAGGLSRLYPVNNQAVFDRLRATGALLISERLWFAPCRPLDFTARNRIIAGLAPLTLIMQAAQRSGALVTARLALDQGRDVGVLRHPEGDARASGSTALLADGAWGFSNARDLVERANLTAASLKLRRPPQGAD